MSDSRLFPICNLKFFLMLQQHHGHQHVYSLRNILLVKTDQIMDLVQTVHQCIAMNVQCLRRANNIPVILQICIVGIKVIRIMPVVIRLKRQRVFTAQLPRLRYMLHLIDNIIYAVIRGIVA